MDYQSHIETVIHYINMQIRHNWSLESDDAFNESTCINTLSQVACLSKRNFQLVFKSIMKESPGQYINRVRLEYGLQLLKEGRYSQKEIAERTGWTNDTAFYNAFKKRYLQSPAKYKSENFVSDVISDTIDCSLLELSEIPIIFLYIKAVIRILFPDVLKKEVGNCFMIMLNQIIYFRKRGVLGYLL